MPKHVADKTRQLSVRVDDHDLADIDRIREVMLQKTSIKPQRSDVVRLALHFGIDEYKRQHDITLEGIELTPAASHTTSHAAAASSKVAPKNGKKKSS